MSTHTPGPWTAAQTYPGSDWCIHARGVGPWQLAYLAKHSQIDWPLEANARLIASSPDLLRELKSCVWLLADLQPTPGLVQQQALAAIAKAEGVQKPHLGAGET